MADSTALVALITGISTVSAGVGGAYLTARQQIESARRQFEAERQKAETERLEQASDRRLETYREFLDVERKLRGLVAADPFDSAAFSEWLDSFNRAYNLLVLTGTPGARDVADRLFEKLREMDRESDGDYAYKFRVAYQDQDAALREIRDELIETMRDDVAPRYAGRRLGGARDQ